MARAQRPAAGWLPEHDALRALARDGWLLFATRALRTAAYGWTSVVLALYLTELGLSPEEVGLILSAALIGSAGSTLLITLVADRLGRRRLLQLGALLMAAAGLTFATTQHPLWLALAAVIGTISPSGGEVGPFQPLEQAILPETAPDRVRTGVFAWYNLAGLLAGAFGALAAGVPALLHGAGLAGADAYRPLLWAYALAGLGLWLLFGRLSARVEVRRTAVGPRLRFGLHRSGRIVAGLAALYALDAFGGGFVVQSLMAYFFHVRFGLELAALGALFFGTNLLGGLSFLAAARVAQRIGLLNTMVFTHLPSNLLLMAVPLMPSAPLAVALLLARSALSQMDIPTRQSFTVAVVAPDERTAAAGLTGLARNVGAGLAPALAGQALAGAWPGLPFLVAGTLKVIYDLAIWLAFRRVRPPEEQARATPQPQTAPAAGRPERRP